MRAIQTRYLGPTLTKPSRIRAWSEKDSVTINFDNTIRSEEAHAKAAISLARKMGWEGTLVSGGIDRGCVFCFTNSTQYKI